MGDGKTVRLPRPGAEEIPLPASLDALKQARNYAVGESLASGGMGSILCAKELNINRTVAMKVMLPDRSAVEESVLRFVEEARITGQLEHPNIVPVHELGVNEQNRPFYTMKFVAGVTLMQVLEELQQRRPETVARYTLAHLLTIFQKVCDAVAFAHARGVVHRDLKPENIMIGEYGEVLVMDWGLAKVVARSEIPPPKPAAQLEFLPAATNLNAFRTMEGTVMGTPHFMAPEQAAGQNELIDARSDIYALGAILYNILALRPPITGDTVQEVLEKVCSGEVHPPTANGSGGKRSEAPTALPHLPGARIPSSLSAVAMKALSLKPAKRYQTVKQLQQDIEAYQNGFATSAEQASSLTHVWLFIKRHKTVTMAAALILIISAAFTVKVITEGRRAETALVELRKTAPAFVAQAKGLVELDDFTNALEKVSYAVTLEPQNADYLLYRANLLEALQLLPEAIADYKRVLNLRADPAAQQNLALCEKLARSNAGLTKLKRESQLQLVNSLLKQGRALEAVPLSRLIGRDSATALPAIKARLQPLTTLLDWKWSRLARRPNGTYRLDLSELPEVEIPHLNGLPITEIELNDTKVSNLDFLKGLRLDTLHGTNLAITDLSPLAEMPLTELLLPNGDCANLTPLHGLPLETLNLSGTPVTDCRPLAGMLLKNLDLSSTKCADISGLRGLPLRSLDLSHTRVHDLSPLIGMPLEELSLQGASDITDIAVVRALPLKQLYLDGITKIKHLKPLAGCKTLETISLPNRVNDYSMLRGLPKLQSIDDGTGMVPADIFWKKHEEKRPNGK